mgnify:CR=1 FL=1
MFGTDRVLLYDVEPWKQYGFGVPNFGENIGTLSTPIAKLADEIGKMQLFIMTHQDAMRTQPPSLNTVQRIGKMVNRVNVVLSGRSKADNELRVEAGHSRPATQVWNVHPVPYFPGPTVRNNWLSEYNQLCMVALANIYQHSDNNVELTITAKFAQDIWVYFREIQRLLASELLALPPATYNTPGFMFAAEHYANYNPSDVTINVEPLDTPGPIWSLPTEDDLRPFFRGIPANMILPNLSQYPLGPVPGLEGIAGSDLPPGEETVGTGSSSSSRTTGGVINPPQI